MKYFLAVFFVTVLPFISFAQEISAFDSHTLIKCNFTNEESEPRFQSLIADAEWSQIVYLTREGDVVPEKNVYLHLEYRETTPKTYMWSFTNQQGEPYIRIQEILTQPVRFYLLGYKLGSYDCYKQYSDQIPYYKRF